MNSGALELVALRPSRIVFGDGGPVACGVHPHSVLDTETVETFTLEEFRALVVSHLEGGRDFVIARVTTQHTHTAAVFHSYYSAVELNKILFCVEENTSSLYRMRARNPVNNLKIVGDVSYYRITQAIVDRAVSSLGPDDDTCTSQPGPGGMVMEAEYFASDEDILFDMSVRRYFAENFPDEKEYLLHKSGTMRSASERESDDKLGLKIILYTNIGTILSILGLCVFFGSDEILLTAMVPLALTLFFSVFFLVLYVVLFETPHTLTSIFSLRKEEGV